MDIEQLEQLAAVIVTAGLVAGNFLMFTPWRDGQDPRKHRPGTPQTSTNGLTVQPKQDPLMMEDMERQSESPLVGS